PVRALAGGLSHSTSPVSESRSATKRQTTQRSRDRSRSGTLSARTGRALGLPDVPAHSSRKSAGGGPKPLLRGAEGCRAIADESPWSGFGWAKIMPRNRPPSPSSDGRSRSSGALTLFASGAWRQGEARGKRNWPASSTGRDAPSGLHLLVSGGSAQR